MKKLLISMITVALLAVTLNLNVFALSDLGTVSDNNTVGTAFNMGAWNDLSNNNIAAGKQVMTIIPDTSIDNNAYFKFTAAPGDNFVAYVGSQYDTGRTYTLQLFRSTDLVNPCAPTSTKTDGITKYAFMDSISANTTYIAHVTVTDTSNTYVAFYFNVVNNARTGSGTFTFNTPSTISNPGNSSMSLNGVDSSITTLDLTNVSAIPANAKLISYTTSSVQSPNQGNVHHKVSYNNSTTWNVSTVSSATSGSYNAPAGVDPKKVWKFKYNALATAKSTMSTIKLKINYSYNYCWNWN